MGKRKSRTLRENQYQISFEKIIQVPGQNERRKNTTSWGNARVFSRCRECPQGRAREDLSSTPKCRTTGSGEGGAEHRAQAPGERKRLLPRGRVSHVFKEKLEI